MQIIPRRLAFFAIVLALLASVHAAAFAVDPAYDTIRKQNNSTCDGCVADPAVEPSSGGGGGGGSAGGAMGGVQPSNLLDGTAFPDPKAMSCADAIAEIGKINAQLTNMHAAYDDLERRQQALGIKLNDDRRSIDAAAAALSAAQQAAQRAQIGLQNVAGGTDCSANDAACRAGQARANANSAAAQLVQADSNKLAALQQQFAADNTAFNALGSAKNVNIANARALAARIALIKRVKPECHL